MISYKSYLECTLIIPKCIGSSDYLFHEIPSTRSCHAEWLFALLWTFLICCVFLPKRYFFIKLPLKQSSFENGKELRKTQYLYP